MRSIQRPNAPHDEPWEVWQPARGYFGVRLGGDLNPNVTLIRRAPKAVKGKAAVKRAKRARHHAGKRPELRKVA